MTPISKEAQILYDFAQGKITSFIAAKRYLQLTGDRITAQEILLISK